MEQITAQLRLYVSVCDVWKRDRLQRAGILQIIKSSFISVSHQQTQCSTFTLVTSALKPSNSASLP